MTSVDLNKLELNEFFGVEDRSQHCTATFPLIGVHGSTNLATVYFELAPGDHLGRHTDSAEELLIVLQGEIEASVGGETQRAGKGSLILIPQMVPHDVRNVGTIRAQVLGVFGGANHIVATFEQGMAPDGSQVVDTACLFD